MDKKNKKQWEYATPFFTLKGYNDKVFITASLDKQFLPERVTQEMAESTEETIAILDCILRFGIASAENQKQFDQRMLGILRMQELPEEVDAAEGLEGCIIEMPMGEGEEPQKIAMAFAYSEERRQQTLNELQAMGAKIKMVDAGGEIKMVE